MIWPQADEKGLVIPVLCFFFQVKRWEYCKCLHPSVHLSRYLLLNQWAEFYQTCYITSPHGKVVWGFPWVRPFVRRPAICLSPVHLSSWTTGRNSTKLATSLPLMVRVCENNIIFPCIRPSVHPSSVYLSSSTTGWNSTKLATSLPPPPPPPMVRVCESNSPSICPSRYLPLYHWIQPTLLHHFPAW